jgi:superfamily I DNA/RNA helicase
MILEAFRARLTAVTATDTTWTEALEEFECADAVTLLTIHRSKGLEYHTVIFLGLDDDQWWAHRYDPDGSTAAFFVGLSRAAHRLIFTTTTTRTSKIADLYEMLTEAGVPEQRWT